MTLESTRLFCFALPISFFELQGSWDDVLVTYEWRPLEEDVDGCWSCKFSSSMFFASNCCANFEIVSFNLKKNHYKSSCWNGLYITIIERDTNLSMISSFWRKSSSRVLLISSKFLLSSPFLSSFLFSSCPHFSGQLLLLLLLFVVVYPALILFTCRRTERRRRRRRRQFVFFFRRLRVVYSILPSPLVVSVFSLFVF